VGLEWSYSRTYRSVADTLRIVESLTLDDLQRVISTWAPDGPATTVLAGPGAEGETPA
jgi:predicted Zn-dependent peptidase